MLLERVKSNINLCGVEISLEGISIPSNITNWQPFSNSIFTGEDFIKAFASFSSIDYAEESTESNAGISYNQKVSFRFPNSDDFRSERVNLFSKVKFIKLKQTNGLDLVIGRNDWNQNVKPLFKSKSNPQLTEVEFESVSIFPTGYTPNSNSFLLPSPIPFSLI